MGAIPERAGGCGLPFPMGVGDPASIGREARLLIAVRASERPYPAAGAHIEENDPVAAARTQAHIFGCRKELSVRRDRGIPPQDVALTRIRRGDAFRTPVTWHSNTDARIPPEVPRHDDDRAVRSRDHVVAHNVRAEAAPPGKRDRKTADAFAPAAGAEQDLVVVGIQ